MFSSMLLFWCCLVAWVLTFVSSVVPFLMVFIFMVMCLSSSFSLLLTKCSSVCGVASCSLLFCFSVAPILLFPVFLLVWLCSSCSAVVIVGSGCLMFSLLSCLLCLLPSWSVVWFNVSLLFLSTLGILSFVVSVSVAVVMVVFLSSNLLDVSLCVFCLVPSCVVYF